jgi:polysaccharide biosynthesis/export protein
MTTTGRALPLVLTGLLLGAAATAEAQGRVPTATAAATATTAERPLSAPVMAAPEPSPTEYIIGPGDILRVMVWKNEPLSGAVPVRPDGKISLPLLHDIRAAGLTSMQLRDNIATALAEFLPQPEVSVLVTEVRSLRVSILGEVHRPGVLELRRRTSILEAIAMAGGFRDFASPSRIMILRNSDEGNSRTQRLRFNYNRAAVGDEENVMLESGDIIIVP